MFKVNISELFTGKPVKFGHEKLQDAFKVLDDAKVKANEALEELSQEATIVAEDIAELTAEFQSKLKYKESVKSSLEESKEKAKAFIGKITEILG